MKHTIYALTMFALAACTSPQEEAIDRHALVTRNNPEVTAMDSLSSLSVIAMPAIENNMGSGFQWIYSNSIIYNDIY